MTTFAGGTLENQNILQVGGNWLNNGTYAGNGINVIFNGAGTQTISASTFNNLEFNKPVGSVARLTGAVTLKGNLTGTSGTLDIQSYFFNRDVVGGTASMTDSATLMVAADNAPDKFANYSLSANSTVILNGTGTQHLLLPGVVYGNLTFQNAGTKILYTAITVKGKLLIDSTAIFDAQNNTINLFGNWQNKGTFTASTSTVVCAGTSKTMSGATTFNNQDITGSYSSLSNMTYNGLLHITSTGSISAASGILTTLNGDLINNGVLTTYGTTVFTGNIVQNFSLINAVSTFALIVNFNGTVSPVLNSTSAPQFGYLNINNTGGVNPSVGWTVVYGLTVATGASFNLGTSSHTFLGNVTNNGTITSDGTVSFLPSGNVTVNFGTNFSSTGRVYLGGSGVLTVAGTPVIFGSMNVNNTNPAGITPSSDWIMSRSLRIVSGSILNAGSRTYTVGANFSNAGTFNAGTSTVLLNGAGTQLISTTSPLYNLTLNKTGDSTLLQTDLPIAGNLQFIKGKLSTSGFIANILPGGSVTGAAQNTGWVNGYLKKNIAVGATTKSFEIGDATYYTAANLTFGSVTGAGDLTLSTTATEHPSISSSFINAARSLNRYYTVSNNGLQYSNCGATFNYVSTDVDAAANTAAFQVQLYNGSSWLMPVTGTRTATSIMASSLLIPGDIAVGEICNAGTAISYASPYCTTAGTATPNITGTTGGTFSSDPNLAINSTTGAIDLAASTVGSHNVVYTVAASGSCGQYFTNATVVIAIAGTWTGGTSNDWNTPGNWACGGVPLSSADVIISAGSTNFPVITGTVNVHTISIEPGSTVTVSGRMNISGNINNSGTFDVSSGTIEMNGTLAQSIPGTAFTNGNIFNLIASNRSAAGLTLTSNLNVFGSLTFSGTGKTLHTSDLLTIRSTATKTARIGDLTGNVIDGKVTVERYINTGTAAGQHPKSWQLISLPTIGQTIYASLQESGSVAPGYGVWITGPSGGIGYDAITYSNSLKYYNSATNSYVGVTDDNAVITNKLGYYVYVRGDRTVTAPSGANSTPVPTVLRSTGYVYQPNNPAPSVPVTKSKFESIGNPYASAIDVSYMRDNGLLENLNNDITVWDPTIAGSYNSGGYQTLAAANNYMPTTPGAPPTLYPAGVSSPYIQSGQAFFVHSANNAIADGNLNFTEAIKYTGDRLVTKLTTISDRQYFRTYLYTAAGKIADGNAVAFDNAFDNVINADDALKISNGGENLGLRRAVSLLSVEARKPVVSSDTIYYEMNRLRQAGYQLRIAPSNMDPAVTAILLDKFLGTSTNLSVKDSSFINFTITTDAASAAPDRFRVVFNKASVLPLTFISISASRKSAGIVEVNWKVENEINVAGYSIERSNNGQQFSGIGTHTAGSINYQYKDETAPATDLYYRVKSRDADGKVQYSRVVKVGGVSQPASISVYPNPVTDGIVQLHFINQKAGDYTMKITNSIGQIIYNGKIAVSGNRFVKQVKLDPSAAHGTYQLEVTGDATKPFSQAVIVE